MQNVIVITSGKGGVGKTTASANIGVGLVREGKRVVLVDTDIGLRNLDVVLGLENRIVYDLVDVVEGTCRLKQALIKDKRYDGLYLLPAAQTRDKMAVSPEQMKPLIEELEKEFDYVLIDSAAGIGDSFRLATDSADRCVIVCTSDPACLRDAACTADLLELRGHRDVSLVVNRVNPKMFSRMKLTVDDIMDTVGLPLLGLVPEDAEVVLAAAQGIALIFAAEDGAAEACLRISRRLRGDYIPLMKL